MTKCVICNRTRGQEAQLRRTWERKRNAMYCLPTNHLPNIQLGILENHRRALEV